MTPPDANLLAPPSALPLSISRVSTNSSTRSRSRSPALSRTHSSSSVVDADHPKPHPPPRSSPLSLTSQAKVWRSLEQVGTWIGSWPSPAPPEPSFLRHFFTSETPSATIELAFYVPPQYKKNIQRGRRYPVVVNLHGGGFTLGTAKDDARWAAFVLKEVDAVVVSVEYRLAPENPFPTAVEDGVEAVLHLADNAEEYGIDPKKMALSGFSAGANLCFAIPLKMQEHIHSSEYQAAAKALDNDMTDFILPEIVSIISWYPPLDMRISRAERRATSVRPDKTLPPILTGLFDQSYFHDEQSKASPLASPSVASDEALQTALPNDIALFLCEWDMLMKEGLAFSARLKKLGKNVHEVLIERKPHAFDKCPNPFHVDPKVALHYGQACELLRDAFKAGT
ncbi:uncharacterized protein KY384_000437 [Bacidia gigantensis]|uniref:uncharacterized protein n=1 Tax=Bacidia gigantensis TaxID=2732470 RepID=UPI001D045F8F|nr:uncharacterized protein KY384_000437 [Bacidia gigantensis]KAG8525677.1 hypothetical protein KY384_000437 [Bacidia gigantensis]